MTRQLLAKYGGVWITTDFALKNDVANVSEQQRAFRTIVMAATDRPMYHNAFGNAAELHAYLAAEGMQAVELNQLDEAPQLSSMKRLALPAAFLQQIKPGLRLWIVELLRQQPRN